MSNLYQITAKEKFRTRTSAVSGSHAGYPRQRKCPPSEVKIEEARIDPCLVSDNGARQSITRRELKEQGKSLQVAPETEPPSPRICQRETRPSKTRRELAEQKKSLKVAPKTEPPSPGAYQRNLKVERKALHFAHGTEPNLSTTRRELKEQGKSIELAPGIEPSQRRTTGRDSQEPDVDALIREEMEPIQVETDSIQGEVESEPSNAQGSGDIVIEGILPEDPDQVREELLLGAVSATDIRPYEKKGPGGTTRWISISIIVIVVLVLAALATSLGIMLSKTDKEITAPPTDIPTTPPTLPPTTERFSVVAENVERLFGVSLTDPTSPQWMATQWLADEDDLLDSYLSDPERFQQRYALVVFYFATGGLGWIDQSYFLLPSKHECEWTAAADASLELNIPGYRGVGCISSKVDSIVFCKYT